MSSSPDLACPSWLAVSASSRDALVAAAQTWGDTSTSESYIRMALAQPDVEMDVLVSAYRYFFYKNNDPMALDVATTVCHRIQQIEQWPTLWDELLPIFLARLDEPVVRLYLSAYAATGLVLARLGSLSAAQIVAQHMQQVNAKEFGADVLLSILNPSSEDE